ncbi:MAG: HAD-IA family hydrolase [Pseudomonadota bacterium]|nr:HAD-IA family hydrolase [Pseudomonadota bacterium]
MFTAIFDLDGTLVDTAKDLMIAGNSTFRELGWTVRLEWTKHYAIAIGGGRSMIRYGLKAESVSYTEKLVNEFYPILIKNYNRTIDQNSVLYDGVHEILDILGSRGWNLGLCTNKPELQADILLSKLGIRSYFSSFIGSDTVEKAKPSAIPLLAAINRANGKLDTSVLVGDTITDFKTARAAKTKFVLAKYGHGSNAENLDHVVADGVAKTAKDIPLILEKLFREI